VRSSAVAIPLVFALLATGACKTASSAAGGVKSAGEAVASGVSSAAGAGTSLVNVNLSNVLNDLAVKLRIDKANIPVNAQIPITIAANVCGVSINVLSVSGGGGSSQGCTAVTASPQLAQAVQQQLSTGGGTQTNSAPATATPPATSTQPTTTPQTTTPPPDATTPPKLN
jgi:hypothetical protein